jgi:hypothetical protein
MKLSSSILFFLVPSSVAPSTTMAFAHDKHRGGIESPTDSALHREMQECNDAEEILCAASCMNATEFNVSIESCQADGKVLKCMNPRGQVSDGTLPGDFFPACASLDADNVTAFPTLPDYPRNDDLCTDFAQTYGDTTEYANTINLTNGNGALFQFSLVDGVTLKGRLAFNGIFGFLAFGLVGPEYPTSNPMLGGKVIVAMRGGNYSASEGLDLSLGPQVDEFVISTEYFAFRHWQTPYSDQEPKGPCNVQMSENLLHCAHV